MESFYETKSPAREHHCSALEDVFCLASINTGVFTRRDPAYWQLAPSSLLHGQSGWRICCRLLACCGPTARVLRWRGPTREGDLSSTAGTTRDHAGIRTAGKQARRDHSRWDGRNPSLDPASTAGNDRELASKIGDDACRSSQGRVSVIGFS